MHDCINNMSTVPECFVAHCALEAGFVVDDLVSFQPLHDVHCLWAHCTHLALVLQPRTTTLCAVWREDSETKDLTGLLLYTLIIIDYLLLCVKCLLCFLFLLFIAIVVVCLFWWFTISSSAIPLSLYRHTIPILRKKKKKGARSQNFNRIRESL